MSRTMCYAYEVRRFPYLASSLSSFLCLNSESLQQHVQKCFLWFIFIFTTAAHSSNYCFLTGEKEVELKEICRVMKRETCSHWYLEKRSANEWCVTHVAYCYLSFIVSPCPHKWINFKDPRRPCGITLTRKGCTKSFNYI